MSRPLTVRGRPSGLTLRGLFLFDPESIMKLDGEPMRAQFTEAGYESLHRGLERAVHLNLEQFPPRLGAQILEALAGAPPDPVLDALRRAISGDPTAAEAIRQLRPWEIYRAALGGHRSELGLRMADYFVHIERESVEVERLLAQRSFRDAALVVSQHPLLRRFVSPVALDALAEAKSQSSLVWFQLPGALAVLVSQVALLEGLMQTDGTEQDDLGYLLTRHQARINPGRQFMQWLKGFLRVETIDDLLDLQIGMDEPFDETTWKRWHSGAIFPPEQSLRRFMDHVLSANSEETPGKETHAKSMLLRIGTNHWAARRIHHVIGLLEHMERTDAQKTAALLGQLSPSAWLTSTYSQWREHWAVTGKP